MSAQNSSASSSSVFLRRTAEGKTGGSREESPASCDGSSASRQEKRDPEVAAGVGDQDMLDAAEGCIREGAEMTPAEVGEVLLRNRDEPETAVTELAGELKARVNAADDLQWEDSAAELSHESPTKKGRKGFGGWEGKVRILGRLRSLTKSDSGRRGV